jgi:hypothetical protein
MVDKCYRAADAGHGFSLLEFGARKLNYISQFYLFAIKYKTTKSIETNEHYFLTLNLITSG